MNKNPYGDYGDPMLGMVATMVLLERLKRQRRKTAEASTPEPVKIDWNDGTHVHYCGCCHKSQQIDGNRVKCPARDRVYNHGQYVKCGCYE